MYLRQVIFVSLFFVWSLRIGVCETEVPKIGSTRPFLMGFSSFIPDVHPESVIKAFQVTNANSDLRSVQIDGGVPWVEMEKGLPIPKRIIADWSLIKQQSNDRKLLLSITSRDFIGTNLALYANEEGNDRPLPADWLGLAQNNQRVMKAYLRYSMEVVNFWKPDYLAINVEANIVANKDIKVWREYLELHKYVYNNLKAKFPMLPVFATIQVEHFKGMMPDARDKYKVQQEALKELLPFEDIIALSVYPYSAGGKLSVDYFDDFLKFDKPVAVAETGWPAHDFTMFGVTTSGDEEAQSRYLGELLTLAVHNKFRFVVNWVGVDYVRLLEKLPKTPAMELSRLWMFNGLWDQDFKPRPALKVWQQYFNQSVKAAS